MCPEMLKRGAPLKLAPNGNAIGRFFPERCTTQVNDGPKPSRWRSRAPGLPGRR